METKFKVGDKVVVSKPKRPMYKGLYWATDMDKCIGKIFEIINVDIDAREYLLKDGEGYWFAESWLTKAEEQPTKQVIEQVTKQVAKSIDWEQRRWELASKIFAETEDITLDSAVRQADIFIKYYKQTLK